MRADDIRAAVNGKDLAELREVFTALVLYPGYLPIDGVRSRAEMAELLDHVAHELREDHSAMPDPLADAIHREVGSNLADRTFAAGARSVRVYAIRWRERFAPHFGPPDR